MKKVTLSIVFVLILFLSLLFATLGISQSGNAQNKVILATTENGRKVKLLPDGTWKYVALPEEEDWSKIVWFKDFKSAHLDADYSRSSKPYGAHVRLYFQFENLSSKKIAGLIYQVKCKDAFGDTIYSTNLKDNLVLAPDQSNPMDAFWYYEDNEFVPGEPYDKLKGAVQAGTLKVSVAVTKIAFYDGTVLEFPKDIWMSPSPESAMP